MLKVWYPTSQNNEDLNFGVNDLPSQLRVDYDLPESMIIPSLIRLHHFVSLFLSEFMLLVYLDDDDDDDDDFSVLCYILNGFPDSMNSPFYILVKQWQHWFKISILWIVIHSNKKTVNISLGIHFVKSFREILF